MIWIIDSCNTDQSNIFAILKYLIKSHIMGDESL